MKRRQKPEKQQISVRISIPIYNAAIEHFGRKDLVRLLERGLLLAIAEGNKQDAEDVKLSPEDRELRALVSEFNTEERRTAAVLAWVSERAKEGKLDELQALIWRHFNETQDVLSRTKAGQKAQQEFREELLRRRERRLRKQHK
jgi:hypothetical protein